jgi:hypothetical protein
MNRYERSVLAEEGRATEPGGGGSRRDEARWLERRFPRRALPTAFAVAFLMGCGALLGGEATVGGETHFLIRCSEDCGPGLSCIDGVCTRGCEPGFSSCSELAAEASCVSVPEDRAEQIVFGGTCDVPCGGDADCISLGAGHSCQSGACRAAPVTGETAPSSASSRLVHAVDADQCKSGLVWVGGDAPSAEMRPGSDCVGCHREENARALLLAGTVFPDRNPGGGIEPQDDCLGLEGVEVVVTDAEGREHSTVTNRAGNFYFEGSPSDLPLPYEAEIRWRLSGEARRTPMATTPEYGGCARCHGSEGPPTEFSPERAAEFVLPTTVLFTPGLHPD